MTIRCKKCNKSFLSEYLLNRHKNKKVPCDVILSCKKCKKIFKTQHEFDNHEKRKFPCDGPKSKEKIIFKNKILLLEKKREINLEIENKKIEIRNKEIRERIAKLKIDAAMVEAKSSSLNLI